MNPISKHLQSMRQADVLLRALAERGDDEAFSSASGVLSGWSDSILELVAEVARGPTAEAPVEEVWHWLAASERLARALSFADHFSVAGLAARLETQQEAAGEAAERWLPALPVILAVQGIVPFSWRPCVDAGVGFVFDETEP
ncbi:unnamed protein product [Symbiodinium sp. CCMP2592]|nr:unnamed protein product [Symbiodinium sp. CCMP2592]